MSPFQIRAARHVLTQMAQAGLAECTESGEWVARHDIAEAYLGRSAAARQTMQASVEAERAAYRQSGTTQWDVARAAALKANYARERAWWDTLPRREQAERRAFYRAKFDAMSVTQQEHWKGHQVDRRQRGGINETARHAAWADGLRWEDVVARSTQRSEDFARLAGPMRQAKAIAWARHREKFGIPRATPTWQSRIEHADVLPSPGEDRDEAHMQESILGHSSGCRSPG